MTIVEALKTEYRKDIRVIQGDRWLYFDRGTCEFVVREQKKYKKFSEVMVTTVNEEVAVEVLLKDL